MTRSINESMFPVSPARGGLRSSPGREAGERAATIYFLFPEPRRGD
jgi:hypothetical protein